MTNYHDHPDWLAFVAAICATPGDDLPRLVAADWLDERGDKASVARAEFVRLQVELARKPRVRGGYLHCRSIDLTDPNTLAFATGFTGQFGVNSLTGPTPRCRCANCRLLRRERDLLARWRDEWDAALLAALVAGGHAVVRAAGPAGRARGYGVGVDAWLFDRGTLHYSRGFVSRLTMPAAAFAEYGAALFAAAPVEQVAFPNLGVRVDIAPPGEGHEWEAYFHSAANAGYIAMDLWEQRHEVAAGISAVVAGWPELATA